MGIAAATPVLGRMTWTTPEAAFSFGPLASNGS
jgi:hypothetical protein